MTAKERIQEKLDSLNEMLEFLNQIPEIEVDWDPEFNGSGVDFNHPTQEQTTEIMTKLGGTWNKEPIGDNAVSYTRTEPLFGRTVRLFCAPLDCNPSL